MHPGDLGARPPALPLEVGSGRTRVALRRLAWLPGTLLAGALLAGVAGAAPAAAWPDWKGTEPKNVSESPTDMAWQPDVAASKSSGRVIVAWSDQRQGETGPRSIYAILSDDNGDTWSAPQAISESVETSEFPDAVIVEDQVFVAWAEGWEITGVYAIYEAELGVGAVHPVPCTITSKATTRPRLTADTDKGKLHVVFNAGEAAGTPDIFYASRPLTATSWPTATRIYTHTGSLGSWYPALAVGPGGETLHVVWQEQYGTKARAVTYMSGTVDGGGVTWSPPLTLSAGITRSIFPDIAADSDGNLHVVWDEQVGEALTADEQYVRYTHYDAASGSWSLPRRIHAEPLEVNSLRPTVLVPSLALWEKDSSVTVCAVWPAYEKDSPVPAEEVLLGCSPDGGDTWEPLQNVSRSPLGDEVSIAPALAFDALGQLHCAWQEQEGATLENLQIYYAYTANKVFLPLVMRNS
jgi:hypothetical protein